MTSPVKMAFAVDESGYELSVGAYKKQPREVFCHVCHVHTGQLIPVEFDGRHFSHTA